MKYFALQTVAQAFNANRVCTKSKFWGLLLILSSINDTIAKAGVSYDFNTTRVSVFLERLFCLEDVKKEYSGSTTWNIILSSKWAEKVREQMLIGSPNIFNVIAWYFRTKAFDEEIGDTALIDAFLCDVHISRDDANVLFDFTPIDLQFAPALYSEQDLQTALGTTGKNITAEGNTIVAHAGELSRAPFIQTLYAGQATLECLIITPFKFSDYYYGSAQKKQAPKCWQKIFFGTPGSGKSFHVSGIVDGHEKFTFRTTFHPDYDYASFVGTYKPVKDEEKGELTYSFIPQSFTNAYVTAWKNPDEPVYLVIEEINRGNCAQIFGDLFQLLDRDEQGESEYPISVDADLRHYLESEKALGKEHNGIKDGKIKLPKNLHILATMNTSDQSLFPMDSAFKRRWEWEYVPVYPANPKSQFIITIGEKRYKWASFLVKVNERIHKLSDSEDKQMGNFFIKSDIGVEEFKSKVMFYLWSEVCKEYEKCGSFFKEKGDKGDNDAEFTFNSLYPTNEASNKRLQGFMEYLGVEEA